MRTAAAVLARGKTLPEAVQTADRVMAAYWRNQRAESSGPPSARWAAAEHAATEGDSMLNGEPAAG